MTLQCTAKAVEAKERLPVEPDAATQASITFQCFFQYYQRLAGMTVRCNTVMVSMLGMFVLQLC